MKKHLLTLITLGYCLTLFAQENKDTSNLLKLGDPMPAFSLKTLDGKEIQSSDLKGKTVLINFFATWCGPCMKELPELQKDVWEVHKNHPDFVLLVIGREETAEKLIPWIPTKGFDLPFFPDPGREVYKKFAKAFIPRNYLFNSEGKLVFQSMGFEAGEFEELKDSLRSLIGSPAGRK